MDDAGRVQVFDSAQHLVQEVRHALVIQIHLNHLTQIRVHQLHHEVTVGTTDTTSETTHTTTERNTHTSWKSSRLFCGVNAFNSPMMFLWSTNCMSLNSRYALLACVTFWKGRESFFMATLAPSLLS
jgi:hypothetical protein